MTISLLEAQTELEQELKDITDVPSATYISWCDYVNKFLYRKLSKADPERFIASQSYTVTASPSTQALPSSFRDVVPKGTGFFLVDTNGTQTDTQLCLTNFGSQDTGYYINGTNVVFTGIEASTIYTLRYIPEITAFTALGDLFCVPDEYNRCVLDGLKVQYFIWDEDSNSESTADFRFNRSLNELLANIKKNPNVGIINNYSNYF